MGRTAASVAPSAQTSSAAATAATVGRVVGFQALPSPLQIANAISVAVLDSIATALNIFPANPITDFLSGALLMVRRNLFDQAPIADPEQYRPSASGEINGWVTGTDPEGDAITYTLTQRPSYGDVVVDSSTGTYVYTPGAGYDPTVGDSFTISESNQGVYNVFSPTGTPSTEVNVTLTQFGSLLRQGEKLLPGEKLMNYDPDNAPVELRMQSNGDLVIWRYEGLFSQQWDAKWSTGTNGHEGQGVFAIMQSDGRFVVYKPDPAGNVQLPWDDGSTVTVVPLWAGGVVGGGLTSQYTVLSYFVKLDKDGELSVNVRYFDPYLNRPDSIATEKWNTSDPV